MSLLAKFRSKYGEDIGVELFFAFPELQDDQRTYLDSDAAAGISALSANGVNFATSQYILIGQPGSLKSELIQISTSTSPTATAITLQSATSFPHNRGDIIRFIPYNQITPERSTNAGVSYSALTAVNIRADSTETYLQRSADAATDMYRFRFSNSSSGLFSAYSDALTASGYADNTVFAVKKRALDQLGEQRSALFSDDFLNDSIMEARRLTDYNPAVFRWSFRTQFGVRFSQLLAGQWSISAPTDLRDRNTNKNILSLRFGAQNRPLAYLDRSEFNQNYLNVGHTTVATAALNGATSLILTSTHDLDSSGTVTVAGAAAGDNVLVVTYTANNKTTNTLSGCTGVTRAIAAGVDIWQRASFGVPSAYTIDNGTIYFDVPLNNTYDGQDVKGDYYRTMTAIDSDADTFDEPFYDLFVFYLKYKMKYKKANGKIERDTDSDYKDWVSGLADLISQETPGQYINFIPDAYGYLSSRG